MPVLTLLLLLATYCYQHVLQEQYYWP